MIEWNAEKQVVIGLYFYGRRLIDRRVMLRWGNPARRGFCGGSHDFVHQFNTLGAGLSCGSKNLNRSMAVVPDSQPQQIRIDVFP